MSVVFSKGDRVIVHCVNSFDALTEANKKLREAIERADQKLSGIQQYSSCKTAQDEAAIIRRELRASVTP
jgi:hypothetical protein